MSRGPGRWQRAILQALEENTEFDIFPIQAIAYEHLGAEATRAQLVAARRAVRTLAIAGKVRAIYRPAHECRQALQLCVTRPDKHFMTAARTNAPGWVTWMDGKTNRERWPDRADLWGL